MYNAWMAEGAHPFTAAGNIRGPPCHEIVKWVLQSWETLGRELIICSFRSCMFTVAPNGSEDDQIHCLKKGQPCHARQDHLASTQQALTASCTTDPFTDLTLLEKERKEKKKKKDLTLLDVEKAAPESSLTELSKDDIEVDLEL